MKPAPLTYWIAVALLIASINASLFASVRATRWLPLAAGASILLLALIILKSRKAQNTATRGRVLVLSAIGAVITAIDVRAGLVFAILGLLLLVFTQTKAIKGENQIWWLLGGNPLHKFDKRESKMVAYGLAMMLSVALTFVTKIIWMSRLSP